MPKAQFLNEIKKIEESFSDLVHYTPLEKSETFSRLSGNEIYLKLENLQKTGAFKIRGAYNKVLKLSESQKRSGVITASAGNHGQAVALAATLNKIDSTIIVPEGAPIVKIEAIKNYGGRVIEAGKNYDEALDKALEIQQAEKMTFIHAFNDMDVIKGQATIGLEILEQLPDVEYIFCPVGGGGLISGISSCCKQMKPDVKVIGVQSLNTPSVYNVFYKKKAKAPENSRSICDGIAVKKPGDITGRLINDYVDDIMLVSDEAVASAILLLMERAKLFVEGAGASALAAVLFKDTGIRNKKVAVVISGGNLTPGLLHRIIEKGLIKEGRLLKIKTKLPDVPGALISVLKVIAREKGNIVTIVHERQRLELKYNQTDVIIELETRDHEHIEQILSNLRKQFQIDIIDF